MDFLKAWFILVQLSELRGECWRFTQLTPFQRPRWFDTCSDKYWYVLRRWYSDSGHTNLATGRTFVGENVSAVDLCRDFKITTWRLVHPTHVFVSIQQIKLLTYSKFFYAQYDCTHCSSYNWYEKIILVLNKREHKSRLRAMLRVDEHELCLML